MTAEKLKHEANKMEIGLETMATLEAGKLLGAGEPFAINGARSCYRIWTRKIIFDADTLLHFFMSFQKTEVQSRR